MVYPSVGIANSTGTGWGTSYGISGTGTTLALTVSPAFTGVPTAPTAALGTNSTQLATTAFVRANAVGYPPAGVPNSTGSAWGTSYTTSGNGSILALTDSAALTGTPTAPTAALGTNTTQLATTAFVLANIIPSATVNGGILYNNNGTVSSVPLTYITYANGAQELSGQNLDVNVGTLYGYLGVSTGPTGAWSTLVPSTSGVLTDGQLACLFPDATPHPCATSTTYWTGVVQAQGTDSFSGLYVSGLDWGGFANCIFDNTAVTGHWVVASNITAGSCHDSGASTLPVTGLLVGMVINPTPITTRSSIKPFPLLAAPTGSSEIYLMNATPAGGGGGSAVYPPAGIANSTGTAWGTSYGVSGTGTSVALTVSPAFTGTPTAPTATLGTNTTQIATTAFVTSNFATLASPSLAGTPTAPTAAPGTSTTQIATTAFVTGAFAPLASPVFTGTPTAPTAAIGTNSAQLATTAFVQTAVTSVYTCGTTTACAGTLQSSARIVSGTVPLTGGSATVTGLPVFTSTTSYSCTCADTTASVSACSTVPASASSITVSGSGGDTISYSCVGN